VGAPLETSHRLCRRRLSITNIQTKTDGKVFTGKSVGSAFPTYRLVELIQDSFLKTVGLTNRKSSGSLPACTFAVATVTGMVYKTTKEFFTQERVVQLPLLKPLGT